MKKTKKAEWIKIYYNYKRTSDLRAAQAVTILENINRNYKELNLAIGEEFKSWSGAGEIIISSITAGPFEADENWGQKMSLKFKNKKIKFNNK